jgi:hypothetical protein
MNFIELDRVILRQPSSLVAAIYTILYVRALRRDTGASPRL